jgi:putative nucleotidyltransferase with HDIG domain
MSTAKLTLPQVLDRVRQLPALPAVVVDVLAAAEQDDVRIEDLARKLESDQALTAKTLRIANSPFYGLSKRVPTARDAIIVLGMSSVRTLVTTIGLMGNLKTPAIGGFDFKALCRHCIATAIAARLLARQVRKPEEIAFTAGLLHDIGHLALIGHFADAYLAAAAEIGPLERASLEAERAALGVDHVEVGAALATHWNFAPVVVEAIAGCHAGDSTEPASLADIVRVADAVAHGLDDDEKTGVFATEEDWKRLAMSPADVEAFHTELDIQLESLASVLLNR